MRKLIVSAWISIDGVFDADTMPQWYAPFDSEERQNYIRDSILACDALLFGRTTFEMLAPYWSSLKNNEMGVADKLNNAPKYVVSANMEKADWNNSTIISHNVVDEITKLKEQPGNEIQIEGSAILVKSLAAAGLIDEYRFLVHPIIAGKGKRFFVEGMETGELKLVKTQPMALGVTLLCYEPVNKAG